MVDEALYNYFDQVDWLKKVTCSLFSVACSGPVSHIHYFAVVAEQEAEPLFLFDEVAMHYDRGRTERLTCGV